MQKWGNIESCMRKQTTFYKKNFVKLVENWAGFQSRLSKNTEKNRLQPKLSDIRWNIFGMVVQTAFFVLREIFLRVNISKWLQIYNFFQTLQIFFFG